MTQRATLLKSIQQTAFLCGVLVCFFYVSPSLHGQAQDSSQGKGSKSAEGEFEKQVLESIARTGVLDGDEISESSGLAVASLPGAYWTINDSGHPGDVFLFREDGKKLAQLKIDGAKNRDWESLASWANGDRHWIVAADVGDNQRLQKRYQLYYFLDPTVDVGDKLSKKEQKKLNSVPSLAIEFIYSDGESETAVSKDCEAVSVDPLTGDIWLTEKVYLNRDREVKPGLYVLPAPQTQLLRFAKQQIGRGSSSEAALATKPLVAKRIGSFPIRNVTGMSFSPDGRKLIIRNYLSAHLYLRPKSKSWRETVASQVPTAVALPFQGQGEAICFTADSGSVLVTSEGKRQPIWKVDLTAYLKRKEPD